MFYLVRTYVNRSFKIIPMLIQNDLQSQPSFGIDNCIKCTVTGQFRCVTKESQLCTACVQVMSADIPMKIIFANRHIECSFNCKKREYSAFGDCPDGLNMLRMRSVLYLFWIIYGYIFESNQLGKPFF